MMSPASDLAVSALISDAVSRTVPTTRNVFTIVDGSANGCTNFGPQRNDTHAVPTSRRLLDEAERAHTSDLAADAVDGSRRLIIQTGQRTRLLKAGDGHVGRRLPSGVRSLRSGIHAGVLRPALREYNPRG